MKLESSNTKPNKDSIKKGHYRPKSFMNIDTKTLNKVLVNRIQQCVKKILYTMTKWDLFPGCKDGSIFKSNVVHCINNLE